MASGGQAIADPLALWADVFNDLSNVGEFVFFSYPSALFADESFVLIAHCKASFANTASARLCDSITLRMALRFIRQMVLSAFP